jgi:uncharacterized RDD family membrane protein YckC
LKWDTNNTIANPFKRLLAVLIDIVVIIPFIVIGINAVDKIFTLPVTPEFNNGFTIKLDKWAKEHIWLLIILYSLTKLIIVYFYFTLLETSVWQGTIGKRLLKIKVTDLKGKRINFKRATIRFLSKILSAQLLIGYIMILFTEKKQGLHDLIAKTLVLPSDRCLASTSTT